MTELSVVIVSYRTPDLTVAAVRSALSLDTVDEVVVVDNASRDSTIERLREIADVRLSLIANDRNIGYGAAANQGARQTDAHHTLFLNSDAMLNESAADALIAELLQHRGRAIVGPRLIGLDGKIQRSSGLLPGPFDLAVRALGVHAVARHLPLLGPLIGRSRLMTEYDSAVTSTEPMNSTMISGACAAIGTDAFRELDGFDESFFLYFEDADLCRRAADAGLAIRYVPTAIVSHVGGASSADDYHFGPHHARSMRVYMHKWYGWPGDALALSLLLLRWMGFLVARRSAAPRAFRALAAAIRDDDPRR